MRVEDARESTTDGKRVGTTFEQQEGLLHRVRCALWSACRTHGITSRGGPNAVYSYEVLVDRHRCQTDRHGWSHGHIREHRYR
jgi:hypothetical protein